MQAQANVGGFVSYAEEMKGTKVRGRSEKFFDHFSQAKLFYHSQSLPEKAHIVQALQFELGKVEVAAIRARMLGLLAQVDKTLAGLVAQGLGMTITKPEGPMNMSVPADGQMKEFQPVPANGSLERSPALSMASSGKNGIATRKVAVLAADGFDDADLSTIKKAVTSAGGQVKIIGPRLGTLTGAQGTELPVDFSFLTAGSVLFDAVYVPGGENSVASLMKIGKALHFITEAYTHCKTIAATGGGATLVTAALLGPDEMVKPQPERTLLDADPGILLYGAATAHMAAQFITAIGQHRHWERETKGQVPA
jgi:catalase